MRSCWGGVKGRRREGFRERSTHPFLFSVRVQLVVHRLDHTPPVNTQTAHSSLLREELLTYYEQSLFNLRKCILIEIIMELRKQLSRFLSIRYSHKETSLLIHRYVYVFWWELYMCFKLSLSACVHNTVLTGQFLSSFVKKQTLA